MIIDAVMQWMWHSFLFHKACLYKYYTWDKMQYHIWQILDQNIWPILYLSIVEILA